ncbi:MAG: hypothetical protein WCA49_02300 [Candidatus Sulfotelmatobacter sp.]
MQVKGLSITLTSGSYWMAVVPLYTNTYDPYCSGVFFLSDVEYINTTPTNAFGPAEPLDASFFDSPYFFLTFDPPMVWQALAWASVATHSRLACWVRSEEW